MNRFIEAALPRILNVHTIKAAAAALIGAGLLSADQLDSVITASGGNVYAIAAGVALYVVYALLRRA